MRRATRSALVLSFCIVLLYGRDAAADWPQWRGANRDAKATGFEAPANWPKELTKKWQVTVGDGVATPALVDGKLYVFTRQDGKEVLRCLDAASHDEIWKEGYEEDAASAAAGSFPGPRSSPTVADGKVVTLGVRGVLVCRDAATGKELWRKDDLANSWPQFFTSSSPIVVDGACIAQLGGRRDGGIVAYDLTSGSEKWRWMESGPAYASPMAMTVDGTKVIVTPTEDKLVALNAAYGKLLWEIPYEQLRYIATTPMVDGTTLLIAGPGSGMTAFKLQKKDDKLVEEKLWRNTDNSVGFNTPVLKDGLLFGITNADQLFCLNTETQKTAWTTPLKKEAAGEKAGADGARQSSAAGVPAVYVHFVQQENRDRPEEKDRDRPESGRGRGFGPPGRGPGGPGGFGGRGFGRGGRGGGMGRSGYGSVVDAGSVLLALSPAGELVAFKPAGTAYSEVGRYKVAEGDTYAYPIPAGHGIYVKDQDALTLWIVE